MSGHTNTYVARGEICMLAGERAAMIYERIRYMVEQNALQGQNLADGKAWIVNTISDWENYFPWLTYKQIRTSLEKLRDLELLEVSQPKASRGDNTFWYTVSCEAQDIAPPSAQKGRGASAQKGRGASAQKGTSTSAQKGRPSAQKGTSIKDKIPLLDKDTCVSADAASTHTEDQFKDFFEAHPRPGDLDQTRVEFQAAVERGVAPVDLIRAAEAYAEEQSGNSKQYIAKSDSWLRRKLYDEQLRNMRPSMSADEKLEIINKGLSSDVASVRENAMRMKREMEAA